ncbi:hypothetical protein [Xanthomonas arboricola]|nr:hypothetical protein [Xanthomonas arboricola]
MNKKMRPSLGGLINPYSKTHIIGGGRIGFLEGPNQGSFAQR